MGKIPIGEVVRNLVILAKANATPIATGAVIIGMVSAVVLAVKAGKESSEDIEEAKELLEVDQLTFKETIRAVWRRFIPVILILGLSIACLVVNTNRMMKRYAALSTAYALSESYLKDYMDSTKESVGTKKEQAIRDDVIEKKAKANPVSQRGIINTGYGDTLFYDALLNKYFRSSMEKVRKNEERCADIYETEDVLTMETYAGIMELPSPEYADYLGWKKTGNIDGSHTMHDGKKVIFFDYSCFLTEFDEQCTGIWHNNRYRITDLAV